MTNKLYLLGLVSVALAFSLSAKESVKNVSEAELRIQKSLNKFCTECHDGDLDEGDIRLDNFTKLTDDFKFEILNKVEEQLYLGNMPPEDEKTQPSDTERQVWLDTIKSWNELRNTKSTFRVKLQSPEFGNYLDHEKLFSGEYKHLKGFTYDRDWLISEYIFREKMNELLRLTREVNIDGKKRQPRGSKLVGNIANPFQLPDKSGIRYTANNKLKSSHLITMTGNVKYISNAMIGYLSRVDKNYLPAVSAISNLKFQHNSIIGLRMEYLDWHIDKLCEDIYKEQNESMLPTYTKIKLEGEINTETKSYGKNGWGGRVGWIYSPYVQAGIKRFVEKDKDRMEIIRECERFYFHLGLDKEVVEQILHIFMREVASFQLYSNRGKSKNLKLSETELSVIKSTIKNNRKKGMTYQGLKKSCLNQWEKEFQEIRKKSNTLNDEFVQKVVVQIHNRVFDRNPDKNELAKHSERLRYYAAKLGVEGAVRKLTETFLLSSEFLVRSEYGVGKADEHGRRMLSPRDASYAIAYALTDSKPDAKLIKAAEDGRLNTRADYKREVERLLKDRSHVYIVDYIINSTDGVSNLTSIPIRKLRFFREFFGYYKALGVFKDKPRFGYDLDTARPRMVAEADMIVERILEKDKNVFEELLTTDEFYIFHVGDNEKTLKAVEPVARAYYYFKKNNWKSFRNLDDVKKHKEFLTKYGLPGFDVEKLNIKTVTKKEVPAKKLSEAKTNNDKKKGRRNKPPKEKKKKDPGHGAFVLFVNILGELELRFEEDNKYVAPYINVKFAGDHKVSDRMQTSRHSTAVAGQDVARFFNINPGRWDYPPEQPAKVKNRMGMLTHPAWLQAFSQNLHTDPVIRGKWIREKLLAGTVPDVPIGVDAVIPEDHTRTLRDRLASKTEVKECWKCHKLMNPLGNAFEMYDDFGRFRTEEELEHPDNIVEVREREKLVKVHPAQDVQGRNGRAPKPLTFYKTLPVDTTGTLDGTGNSKLDGDVNNAFDMISRLVKAKRVRQSIIRHAFRYFMGRNEMLSDSKTLIDAEGAYLKSGGSFDAVIVSLLTSDSFIFRKQIKE